MSGRELGGLADRPYDGALLERELESFIGGLGLQGSNRRPIMRRATGSLLELLERRGERTLQDRWEAVERELWAEWHAGGGRLEPAKQWSWGTAALVLSRAVRPGWVVLPGARLSQWVGWLPADHPLPARYARLGEAVAGVDWASEGEAKRRRAALLGLRILLAHGLRGSRPRFPAAGGGAAGPGDPLAGVLLNVLATLGSFGVGKWIFQDGVLSGVLGFQSQGYLNAWAPIFFFVMLFTLGMDYTVFLLASAKERWDHSADAREAAIEGIALSGAVITAAAAVMIAVFFTFALSGPLPPKEMGIILGVAVLIGRRARPARADACAAAGARPGRVVAAALA